MMYADHITGAIARVKLYIHTHNFIRLTRTQTIGTIIVSTALIFGLIRGFVLAAQDEVGRIKARIQQLQDEIERNGREYQGISQSIDEDRARCDLAAAKSLQLSKLNGANNAKRTEIEVLESLLQREDAEVKLGK